MYRNQMSASNQAGLIGKEGLQDEDLSGWFCVEHLCSDRQARPTLRATLWDFVTLARTWTTAWVLDAGCGLEKASLSEGSDSGTLHTEPQACRCCNSFMQIDAARSSCC